MKKIEPGPIGVNVARNVRRLRQDAGYGYAEISRYLDAVGRPIPPLGLRHLEEGKRRVDVDELVMLACALGVAPLTLLLPEERAEQAKAVFTGEGRKLPQLFLQARVTQEAFTDGDD